MLLLDVGQEHKNNWICCQEYRQGHGKRGDLENCGEPRQPQSWAKAVKRTKKPNLLANRCTGFIILEFEWEKKVDRGSGKEEVKEVNIKLYMLSLWLIKNAGISKY